MNTKSRIKQNVHCEWNSFIITMYQFFKKRIRNPIAKEGNTRFSRRDPTTRTIVLRLGKQLLVSRSASTGRYPASTLFAGHSDGKGWTSRCLNPSP